ncbi:MAG: hypothetical protein JO266_19455 [Acidobacteria bacterium]|nr:hypothetical protein [Acidobacteriota bacterium]MBV8894115.1 hypothetical protein [Acidobacteriota bacterium]
MTLSNEDSVTKVDGIVIEIPRGIGVHVSEDTGPQGKEALVFALRCTWFRICLMGLRNIGDSIDTGQRLLTFTSEGVTYAKATHLGQYG